jgi:hypothetical protein
MMMSSLDSHAIDAAVSGGGDQLLELQSTSNVECGASFGF